MEALEARALQLPGVQPCRHRFGGAGFACAAGEFAHLHGNGLLDVHLSSECAEAIVAAGRASPHHVFGPCAWVSFWIRSEADLPDAMHLLILGAMGRPVSHLAQVSCCYRVPKLGTCNPPGELG